MKKKVASSSGILFVKWNNVDEKLRGWLVLVSNLIYQSAIVKLIVKPFPREITLESRNVIV